MRAGWCPHRVLIEFAKRSKKSASKSLENEQKQARAIFELVPPAKSSCAFTIRPTFLSEHSDNYRPSHAMTGFSDSVVLIVNSYIYLAICGFVRERSISFVALTTGKNLLLHTPASFSF